VRFPAIELTESVKSFHTPPTPFYLRLSAQFSFCADFACNSSHFAGERVELVHHRVDGVLQFQDFAAHVHCDLERQISIRHRSGHFRNVPDLRRQIAGHRVDGVRQILPHAADALHHRLAAQLALGADFARHARHFAGE